MRTESQEECGQSEQQLQSFGEINFWQARLGDCRRTKRLVSVANALVRHPGGSLPEKLRCSGELDGLYHLMKWKTVAHETVLAAHRALRGCPKRGLTLSGKTETPT